LQQGFELLGIFPYSSVRASNLPVQFGFERLLEAEQSISGGGVFSKALDCRRTAEPHWPQKTPRAFCHCALLLLAEPALTIASVFGR